MGEEETDEETTVTDDFPPSGIIGQLPTESELADSKSGKDCATLKTLAWDKVKSLFGSKVVIMTKKNLSMIWKANESIGNNDIIPEDDKLQYGLKTFLQQFQKSDIIANTFLCLMPQASNEYAGYSPKRNFLLVLQS